MKPTPPLLRLLAAGASLLVTITLVGAQGLLADHGEAQAGRLLAARHAAGARV